MNGASGMKNMVKVSPWNIPEILETMKRHKRVPAFMGPPGIGKTQIPEQSYRKLAASLGKTFVKNPSPKDWNNENFCFLVVNTSQMEEIEAKGLPVVTTLPNGEQTTVYIKTELMPTEGMGVLFLDEFANGKTEVQCALQRVILEREAGNYKISDDIDIIISSNRPQDGCDTSFIAMSARNRINWFEVEKGPKKEWFKQMELQDRPIEVGLRGFIETIGGKLYDCESPTDEDYAYPTPRSLEVASNFMKDAKIRTSPDNIIMYVGSAIGESYARDLVTFLSLTEKIDMEELLKKPQIIHKYKDNIGTLYAICSELVNRNASNPEKNFEPIFKVIEEMDNGLKEYGVFLIKGSWERMGRQSFLDHLNKVKDSNKISMKYGKLLL